MKRTIVTLAVLALAGAYGMAADPVDPSTVGLTPRTATIYVTTNYNNGSLDAVDIDINSDTNVVVGFEDDINLLGNSLSMRHWAANWMLYDRDGNSLTPEVLITNRVPAITVSPDSILTSYRAFFRDDGTPLCGRHGWGPKIKANHWGAPGFGMGIVCYAITDVTNSVVADQEAGPGWEIPSLFAFNDDPGGSSSPAVQLMNNDQTPIGTLMGATAAEAAGQPGSIRIADWDYLSDGNIVIAGESRQVADRAFTGQTSGNVPTYRILTPAGVEVRAYTNISSSAEAAGMWFGVAVSPYGWAARFEAGGRAKIRLFDNAGNPTSPNIDIADLTGIPQMSGGGRGDGAGFRSNYKDAYVIACTGGGTPYVGVINTNGTLRWARRVADAADSPNSDRLNAAIAPDGRVIVVFDSTTSYTSGPTIRTQLGRMFDSAGNPMGGIFYTSENENPAVVTDGVGKPRCAWRGNLLAVEWMSGEGPIPADMAAFRLFDTPAYTPSASVPITGFTGTISSGTNMVFSWAGGSPPFTIQKKDVLEGSWSNVVPGLSYRNGTHVNGFAGSEGYYRVQGMQP